MATTNLISKSLGDILTETGNGVPDHTSPAGSIYVDQDTAKLYINKGGTAWDNLKIVSYGEGYYQDNTTQTTISSTNVWVPVGNTFTEGDVNGVTASTDTLVVGTGRDGTYQIDANATIDFVAGTSQYEVGISINGATPASGSYQGATIESTYTTANITNSLIVVLSAGDTIELAVRNLSNTNNVIITHGQIFAARLD